MPVNHVKEFRKYLHAVTLFFNCFLKTLSSYLRVFVSFSKNFFNEKSFQMFSSISGLMSLEIRQPWMNSTV